MCATVSGLLLVCYSATSGVLSFAPGETLKSFEVKTVANDDWSATLEFSVHLEAIGSFPGDATYVLSNTLHSARVKIIDNDNFPTNKHAEAVTFKLEEEVCSKWQAPLSTFASALLHESCRIWW